MSEYQYYEFVAIDRPLTEAETVELRKLSSRAEITSTRFSNEYSYSDFRGDENIIMAKYFDAMVYVANWGTHRFLVVLPVEPLDAVRPPAKAAHKVRRAGHSFVLDFRSETEDSGWEEGDGYLAPIVGVRDELVRGDLRALYLGWLSAAELGHLKDDAPEPPVPPGMRGLSASLRGLAEYLRIDSDLMAFCLDYFPEVHRRFASGMDRTQKESLLLELADLDALAEALRTHA